MHTLVRAPPLVQRPAARHQATMEIDDTNMTNNNMNNSTNTSNSRSNEVSSSSLYFDLETYISRYDAKSETRLQRLFFIASQTSNEDMARMCLEMAESQLKAMGNTKVYREIYSMMNRQQQQQQQQQQLVEMEQSSNNSNNSTNATTTNSKNDWYYYNLPQKLNTLTINNNYDSTWVSATDQAAQFQLETLHSRLLTAQSHLAKEAVRSAYISLANFHKNRGFLKEAFAYILKSRDYCTTHLHTAETYIQAIELCFDMKNYGAQLHSFIRKLQQAATSIGTTTNAGSILIAKASVVQALSLLQEGNYGDAATQLASISVDFSNQFNTVISAEDIVLYTVLLGLASFDRRKIQTVMFVDGSFTAAAAAVGPTSGTVSSSSTNLLEEDSATNAQPTTLKQRLELVPWMSDIIQYYVRAEYGKFLSILEQHRIELQMDLRISPHLETLYDMIRSKCIVQYIVPYSSVDLKVMRRQFDESLADDDASYPSVNSNKKNLEDFVANLITTGVIPHARINLQHGTVVTKEVTLQKNTMRRVEQLGDQFLRDAEAIMLRMACVEHNIIVQESSSSDQKASSGRPQRKPSNLVGSGRAYVSSHLAQGRDIFQDDENDISSDSSTGELQDEIMYADDGNETAMMMDVSDSMIENTQSA